MILQRRIALNGIWMDELDNRIVISGIEPGEGRENITATDAASGFGQRITGQRRSTLDIAVRFRIYEHGRNEVGMTERAMLLEKINTWARPGGILTVNYKPGRRLNVVLAQAPGEGSLWDYTKEFAITFRAYAVPYWEDEEASTAEAGGSTATGSGDFLIEGSADTQADVILQNTSGAQNKGCTVTVGGKTMNFSGITLAAEEALVIDHVDGLVRIRIKNGDEYRSAMALRDANSANDFLVPPGAYSFSYSAQRACRMTVNWRNRYL